MRLILASQSPSRASILRGAGVEPVLEPADIDERALEAQLAGNPPADTVAALATAKAEKVASQYPNEPVIGGDSMLLLDGERMLLADDLRIGESCLRWWSNAAALAAPGAPVHLVGVAGPVARALATWTQPAYAHAELADRAPLRMPPTVRVAALDGDRPAVEAAIAQLRAAVPSLDAAAVLGPVPRDEGTRALVRFDYGLGPRVTETLRAAVVAQALSVRRGARGRPAAARNTLRVRVDVPDLDL